MTETLFVARNFAVKNSSTVTDYILEGDPRTIHNLQAVQITTPSGRTMYCNNNSGEPQLMPKTSSASLLSTFKRTTATT